MSATRTNSRWLLILGALCLSIPAWGQGMGQPVTQGIMTPPANVRPPGLKNVGIEQRLNQQVPLDLAFRDETGKAVRLGDYFGHKPVILNLVYYKCPMLCSQVLIGLTSALRVLKFDVGNQFNVVTVSFNPRETPEIAAATKADYLKRYGRAGAAQGWPFLTGPQESITALTRAVGFQYQYDPATDQYAHGTAIMVLTPDGRVAQYYYGVEFAPKDLRLGLIEASNGKIGNLVDEVLLYCYHYDPAAGKYGAVIARIVKLSGIATVVALGGMMLILFRMGSAQHGSSHGPASHGPASHGQEQNGAHRYV
jgi:protein SCO1/2